MNVFEKEELIKKIDKKDMIVNACGVVLIIWKKDKKYLVNQMIVSSKASLILKLDKVGLELLLNSLFMNIEKNGRIYISEKETRIEIDEIKNEEKK